MKKITLVVAALCMSVMVMAQGEAFTKFYNKYADNDQFTTVNVGSKMLNMFSSIQPEDPEDKEVMEALKMLKGIKVLAADSIKDGRKYYKEATASLGSSYEELMSIRQGKDDMKFMIKEANGKISELLMIVGGDTKFFYVSLFGEIDLNKISKLSKNMKIDGLQYLDQVDDKNKKKN